MAVRLTGAAGTWVLPEGETILGRGDGCGMRIDDPRLSRQHARLLVEGSHVRVFDLGSANGVLVNSDRIDASAALRSGDTIVCGPVRLTVETDGERAPAQVKGDGTTGTLRALVGEQRLRSTEAMAQDEIQRALAEGSGSRPLARLDPAIAAALTGGPPKEGSTSIRPSEMLPVSSTTALSPHRFHEPSTLPDEPRRTTSILPNEAPDVDTAALVADEGRGPRPSPRLRILAGFFDPLLALLLGAAIGGAIALAGTVAALAWSGAGVVDGRFTVPGAPAASLKELLGACLTVPAWQGLGDFARQIHGQGSLGPFLLLFLSWAVGAVAVELTLLLRLVAATVGQGGPALHRRCGLVIAVRRNGHHPGWARALWRWTVLGITAPAAVATAACGVRGLHDLASGCEVRKR